MTHPLRWPSPEMLAAIGACSISWATMEMGLDLCSTLMFLNFGGNKLEKEAPRAFKRKITLVRRCVRDDERLTQYAPRLVALLDQLGPLAEFRQQIAHGAVVVSSSRATVSFTRLLYNATGAHVSRTQEIEISAILNAGMTIDGIAHDILGIGLAITRSLAPPGFYDDIDKAMGEL
jgi:hypothetical protein